MRIRVSHLVLLAAAGASGACERDRPDVTAPQAGAEALLNAAASEAGGPLVRITSPLTNEVVSGGAGLVGAGSLTGGSAFAITIETVTNNAADVPAVESINIRNTALLGPANPNSPGLTVLIDADLIAPDGTIIPRNTNLANLFNTLGTDDTPGDGVTI